MEPGEAGLQTLAPQLLLFTHSGYAILVFCSLHQLQSILVPCKED